MRKKQGMNIHEVATSGKPFRNPSMIGAWMIVDGALVHRDIIADFKDLEWIRENSRLPNGEPDPILTELYWMHVEDLTRNDWEIVE